MAKRCAKLNYMQLYIIRHAQSTNNALADVRQRVCDPDLTELGRRQAEILAQHLASGPSREPWWPGGLSTGNDDRRNGHGYALTRLFCSPQRRSLLTARPIARAIGLQPEIWVDIHEEGGLWLDHGDPIGIRGYPGMTREALAAEFPGYHIPSEITDAGWWQGGQETPLAAAQRAARVAQALRDWPNPADRIAIVTHGAFSTWLLRTLLGCSTAHWETYYHLDNASISLVQFHPDGSLALRYLNRVEHLPPEMIT